MKRVNIFSVKLVKESGKLYEIEGKSATSPSDAVDIVNAVFDLENLPKEHFVILCLSTKNTVVGAHIVHIGTVNASMVSPRDVFQLAILNNASSIIAFHNHPSGNPTPSKEDKGITLRLKQAGELLGIELLDHIVVGNGRYKSLREEGVF